MSSRFPASLACLLAVTACGTPPKEVTLTFINVPPAGVRAYISEPRAGFLQPSWHYTRTFDLTEGENRFAFTACMPLNIWVVGFWSMNGFKTDTRIDVSELVAPPYPRKDESEAKRQVDEFNATSHRTRSCLPS